MEHLMYYQFAAAGACLSAGIATLVLFVRVAILIYHDRRKR